jgi:hypothetical protein
MGLILICKRGSLGSANNLKEMSFFGGQKISHAGFTLTDAFVDFIPCGFSSILLGVIAEYCVNLHNGVIKLIDINAIRTDLKVIGKEILTLFFLYLGEFYLILFSL